MKSFILLHYRRKRQVPPKPSQLPTNLHDTIQVYKRTVIRNIIIITHYIYTEGIGKIRNAYNILVEKFQG